MFTAGVDKAGTVLGDAERALGPIGAGVAFDGVPGRSQSAGALEQARALAEEVVDVGPTFRRRLCAGPVVQGRVQHGGPAGAVCLHLAEGGFAQVVPHMPTVSDLDGVRQGASDGLGVDHHGGTAVPPAQGEVIDADHAGYPPGGQRDAQQGAQSRVTRQAHRGSRRQRRSGPAR